ncbi:hypothetical protein CD31_10655 [Lysinibacillus boronitolerans JCM 21713 = 10a = NBRC 103108]|uniref:Uncharacterized protein n=1 Tax=Lysinibacillus boronitolerans JCM 21713 = 10a = NBRC 103108 TaxID=1294264 RepID=A0ABR4Y0A4_9BACI|nr:hypothetical protein CD31_10655 [Lysinibacillus boronitolerans JCM 21713 = 10a = NBRC 103108]
MTTLLFYIIIPLYRIFKLLKSGNLPIFLFRKKKFHPQKYVTARGIEILLQQIVDFFMNEKMIVVNNLVKWLIILLLMEIGHCKHFWYELNA